MDLASILDYVIEEERRNTFFHNIDNWDKYFGLWIQNLSLRNNNPSGKYTCITDSIINELSKCTAGLIKDKSCVLVDLMAGNGDTVTRIADAMKKDGQKMITCFSDAHDVPDKNGYSIKQALLPKSFDILKLFLDKKNTSVVVLCIICPPPSDIGGPDQWLLCEFKKFVRPGDIIITLGELGASDGTKGFICEINSFMKCVYESIVGVKKNSILGTVTKRCNVYVYEGAT